MSIRLFVFDCLFVVTVVWRYYWFFIRFTCCEWIFGRVLAIVFGFSFRVFVVSWFVVSVRFGGIFSVFV